MSISLRGVFKASVIMAPLLFCMGCERNSAPKVAPPDGFVGTQGTWCYPDNTSARKTGDEAIFTYICEDGKNQKIRAQFEGDRMFGAPIQSTLTWRFNCSRRRIVEQTTIIHWEISPPSIKNSAIDELVVPNSPREEAMDYACAQ